MKDNQYYRKFSTSLNIAPTENNPTPMTRTGTNALVERFYALKRSQTPPPPRGAFRLPSRNNRSKPHQKIIPIPPAV